MELRVVTDTNLCDAAYAKECVTVGLFTTAQLEYIKQPVYSLVLQVEVRNNGLNLTRNVINNYLFSNS